MSTRGYWRSIYVGHSQTCIFIWSEYLENKSEAHFMDRGAPSPLSNTNPKSPVESSPEAPRSAGNVGGLEQHDNTKVNLMEAYPAQG